MKSSDVIRSLKPDDAQTEESISATLYPLRFLGMGLFIAWMCCTHVNTILPGSGFDMQLRNDFDMGMRYGDIGTFILLALLASRIGRLSRHVWFCATCVIITTLGTALVGLVLIPQEAAPHLITVVSILTAIGGAVLFCLWAETYSQMGMTRALMYGAFSCITAAVVSFLVSTMTPPYAIIATALLPCFSLIAAFMSLRLVPKEQARLQSVRYPLPWKLIIIMAIAGFLSGIAGSLISNADGLGSIHRITATGLAGVAIILMAFIRKDRIDVRFLAKIGLPLSIVALALIPFAGEFLAYVVSILIKLAYVWFTFFVLLVLASISFRFEVPSLRMFAIARASSELFLLFGVMLRRTLTGNGLLANEAVLVALSLGGIVLVLGCVLIWVSEKTVNSDWGAAGISLTDKLRVPSPREQFLMRCDKIASQYNLTAREAEIMALIAQRKSRAEIEQELFLSQNTIKTHVRHLYAKLDAHSKADVIALFEES